MKGCVRAAEALSDSSSAAELDAATRRDATEQQEHTPGLVERR